MKLTLRDLFWLITLAGIVVAWWVDRQKLADRISQLEKEDRFVIRLTAPTNNITEAFGNPAWFMPGPSDNQSDQSPDLRCPEKPPTTQRH